MAAVSAALGVVDINTALRDGGCAGEQTHSLRAAAAAAAVGYRPDAAATRQHDRRRLR